MAAGQRPGGLTALAVLNFIWGGIIGLVVLLAVLVTTAAQTTVDTMSKDGKITVDTRNEAGAIETKTIETTAVKTGFNVLWIINLIGGAMAILLITSGVGYLGQKRVMGRVMGNVYALLSIAWAGLSIASSGMGIMTIIFLVYPVLTLLLVNTTFKNDLVN